MRRVLSVSLGSSQRDKAAHLTLAGEEFQLERRGTDGNVARFAEIMREHDGQVDALCVGGANLGLHWRGRYYPFTEINRAVRAVRVTPVVDGAGVKNTLERETVRRLEETGEVDVPNSRVFLVCGIDRFGMAEALSRSAGELTLGDLMLNLGVPIPIRSLRTLDVLAPLLMPVLRRVPFRWLYPTGSKQDQITPKWGRWYEWADVIAGDFLLIRRFMPEQLQGKVILTNSTTVEDLEELSQRGVEKVITTTLVVDGRSFATNVLEGVFVALLGEKPPGLMPPEYLELAESIGWEPTVRRLPLPQPEGVLK
jgi:hypothetical protein